MVFTPKKETCWSPPRQFRSFLHQLQTAQLQTTNPVARGLPTQQQGATTSSAGNTSTTAATSPTATAKPTATANPTATSSAVAISPGCLSIALPLPDLDPLTALEQLNGFSDPHFYWEQPSAGLAIAAAGAALRATFQGAQRFSQAQAFVNQQQRRMVTTGAKHLPGAAPRFFCSFTFFDQVANGSPFPPATVLLPRWQVIRQQQPDRQRNHPLPARQIGTTFIANFQLQDGQVDLEQARATWKQYQALLNIQPSRPPQFIPTPNHSSFNSEAFETSVAAVLEAIERGEIHKAVMAQVLQVQAEQPFSPGAALRTLRSRHPDCYSFCVGGGDSAVFLGASPERLIQVHHSHLYTEALAGSAPRGATPATDIQLAQSLSTSPKELHEHQLVADFIDQQLQGLGLSPHRNPEPQVFQLTGIQHLQTPIQSQLPPSIHPFEVLANLHPTPAVAGVPRQAACEQIQRLEGFERALYAAPLGWIDSQGDCEFCVGIRSALLQGNQAQLFAGAGIVSGSVPAQERAEVLLKLRTLLTALTSPNSFEKN